MATLPVVRISVWGQYVGAAAEQPDGSVAFEYAPEFRTSGLELSPIHLPLSRGGPLTFPELRRREAFDGLPGLLADSLPDAFGNAVIRRWFEQRGTPRAALSPIQKLLYIGGRAMGALEFSPPIDRAPVPDESDAIDVARLVTEARRVIEGDTSVAVPEIMQLGASAGGARAKALVLWNRSLNRVKSALATTDNGDEPWLIKFDGVTAGTGGHELREDVAPGPWGRIEFVYSRMARAGGIEVSDTHLLYEREYAHFMTKRFDRDGAERLHVHTLGGLQHVDYNERGAFSYEEWFRTIRLLGMDQPTLDEAFRRMVFNLAGVNQDDHVKNIAFRMRRDGRWHLAPAYDLTFAAGNVWTRTHQMTLGGKDDEFTRADILAAGAAFDVAHDGARIIDEVDAALGMWEREAVDVGVAPDMIDRIARRFRRFVK